MKKIFSLVTLAFLLPFKVVKKWSKDSFVAGLVFGAIFSLFVNIVTVRIQEEISKQRVLEAVEWEIYNNSAQANSTITRAATLFKSNEQPNPFYSFPKYSRNLWEQSTEPLQYIAQLPPQVQAQVVVYYTVTIKGQNELIENLSKYAESHLKDCYPVNGFEDLETESKCKLLYYQLVKNNVDSADSVFNNSMDVLEVFHPTQDRLNNWFLKLMMGDKSVRVLSGK